MNDKERICVESVQRQLSASCTKNIFTDFECLKWLQENKYNVDNTCAQLEQYARHLNSYDFSKKPKFSDIMDIYWTFGFIDIPGRDKDRDYYLYIDTLGTLDGDGVMKSVPQGHLTLHRFYCAEYIAEAMRKHERETGRRTDQISIFDMAGSKLSAKNVSLLTGPFLLLVKTMVKFYSICSSKFIIINVPHLGSLLYNAFKPILPERTKKKIIILGSNWKKEILDHVDADVLPGYYGGNLVDENNDPKCPNKIVYTKDVPSNLYWTPSKDYPKSDELTVLTVPASDCQFVTVEIDTVGSVLEWYYNTDAAWGFGVFYTDDPTNTDINWMDMVYPQIDHFSGSTRVMENDRIVCKKRGFYKIWFNNSFSWFSKVHVYYKINVIKES